MEASKFDIADYLDSKEMIAKYLIAFLEEGNNSDVITAIGHVAKAIDLQRVYWVECVCIAPNKTDENLIGNRKGHYTNN